MERQVVQVQLMLIYLNKVQLSFNEGCRLHDQEY